MKKINYQNRKDKEKLKIYFPNMEDIDIEKILFRLSTSRYKLERPAIFNIKENYDDLAIYVFDMNDPNKELKFSYDLKNNSYHILKAKRKKEKIAMTYTIIDNNIVFSSIVYESNEENYKIEKFYTTLGKDKHVFYQDNIEYFGYHYTFHNSFLNADIFISFKKTQYFNENSFIAKLIEEKDKIQDILTLYQVINKYFNKSNIRIKIINQKEINIQLLTLHEEIETENGYLKTYIKRNNEEKKVMYFKDNQSLIINEDNHVLDDEISKVKKIIK